MRKTSSVVQRAKRPNSMFGYCRAVGCAKAARAGTGNGLDTRYCRKHADHYGRHGSPFKGSYRAAELEPNRRAVSSWIKAHAEDVWVLNALERIVGLYHRGGRHEEAFRLRGMTARERAWKAWARLREAKVEPSRILEEWLTVELTVAFDPQPDDRQEFKQVQAAKLIHRLASGSHRRWEYETLRRVANHFTVEKRVEEMHVYPHSRGRVLRHVGADMEDACSLVVLEHLSSLKALAKLSGR